MNLQQIRNLITASILVLLGIQPCAAQFGASASYNYRVVAENDGTPDSVYENSVTDSFFPINESPSADFFNMQIQADGLGTSITRLKAKASVKVDVNSRNTPESWKTVTASAKAKSNITTPTRLINIGETQRGFVHFSWTVSGFNLLELQTGSAHTVGVDDFQIFTTLTSSTMTFTQPSRFPWVDITSYDGPATSNDDMYFKIDAPTPGILDAMIVWDVNQPIIPVDFELRTQVAMSFSSIDSSEFKASVVSDLSSTATLQSVVIRDELGTAIPGAALTTLDGSFVFPVPEPSGGFLIAAFGIASAFRRRRVN